MQDEERLSQWLRLAFSYGVGAVTLLKLLRHFGAIENIYAQSFSTLSQLVGDGVARSILSDNSQAQVEQALSWRDQAPLRRFILTLEHQAYPMELATIANPPPVLFAEGDIELLKLGKIAIVGSRRPTPQGMENAFAFAREIVRHGLAVVSGLAQGIDRSAHEGGMAATIAVLGTGIDLIYPAANRDTFYAIREQGLLLSEYALGMQALMQNFPRRNRIIAGLSKACLVIESAVDGGSMITAGLALEMGREVLAIPGSIHNPMARGCHKLIRDGAKLCETVADILEELPRKDLAQDSALGVAVDPLLQIMGHELHTVDSLAAKLSLDFAELCGKLLELELAGLVVDCGGGRYQRIF